MTPHDLTLRRIALVVVGLDPHDAERLLAQFSPEDAARVRRAMATLGEVSVEEEEAAIRAFLRAQSEGMSDGGASSYSATDLACTDPSTRVVEAVEHDSSAVELDASLARKFATDARRETPRVSSPGEVGRAEESPLANAGSTRGHRSSSTWRELPRFSAASLAECLSRENVQTSAVVLACLTASHAAAVLAELSEETQAEVLRRLPGLRLPTDDLLEDIARGLIEQLSARSAGRPASDGQLTADERRAAVAAILEAADGEQRIRWSRLLPERAGLETPVEEEPRSGGSADGARLASKLRGGAADRSQDHSTNESHSLRWLDKASLGRATSSPTTLRRVLPYDPSVAPVVAPVLDPVLDPVLAPAELDASTSRGGQSNSATVDVHSSGAANKTAGSTVDTTVDTTIDTTAGKDDFPTLDDVLELSEEELILLVASADPWAVALTLAGAEPAVAERWLERMPSPDARLIRSQLTRLGPWRLADAEEAERQLLATARRLFTGPTRRG